MKPIHSFFQFGIALFLWSVSAPAAHSFRVLEIQSANAQGLNGAEFPVITIPRGHTITLSFIPSGHHIQSIWLDDPSWIVLNTDSPLCQDISGAQVNGPCGTASVIRIRQLAHPISFSANERTRVVDVSGLNTILTVLAINSAAEHFVYQFELDITNTNRISYSTIRIIPTDNRPPGIIVSHTLNQVDQIRRGLQRAQQESLIDASSPEWTKLQFFLEIASSGNSTIEDAIYQSGVSREFIGWLASMGVQ